MTDKGRILVVDDNQSQCLTLRRVLEHMGYGVDTAESGPDALALAREQPFELVLMDIKMVPMNGVEAFRELRKIRPGIVGVFMTAYAVEDLVQQARREGAYDILHKPVDLDHTLDLLERALEEKRTGKGPAP